METETQSSSAAESMTFRAEVRQLLDILARSLYTEREIFLRELISNASDALNRIQFEMLTNRDVLDPEAELAISLEIDNEANTITIKDTGIGMTHDEIIENLGTIARSGARAFIEQLGENKQASSEVIGQFGVGFYSVFMVADHVRVISRSFQKDAEAVKWDATGGDTFTIEPAERNERGTTIVVHLKEDAAEFANDWRIRQVVKRHSQFVAFPIYFGEERINEQKAIWRRQPREVEDEMYKKFYQQLTMEMDEPLMQVHISTDAPVDLHTVLFVPSKRERGLIERRIEGKIKLYSRKVLIQEEAKDLLPTYFRFIEGVIDSEDLPLNVSRETVQSSAVAQRIRKTLTGRLVRELSELADKDADTYEKFWNEFGVFIKEGIATEFIDREDLLKLLRFHTTHSEKGLWSLVDYKSRIIEGQEEIYYVLANDVDSARRSPHLDPLASRGIEVLLMTDIMDSFMLTGLREYEGMKLRNIDDTNLNLPGEESASAESVISDEDFERLQNHFKHILGDRISEVRPSTVLRNNPSRLVSGDDVTIREMNRIQQLLGRETETQPRILEINRAHPMMVGLVQRISTNADDPVVAAVAEQIYDNALLLEGIHPNPASMVPRIQTLIEAVAYSKE